MSKRIILLVMMIAPIWMSNSPGATKVDFFRGSLNTVKIKAATEGKLYFVDFVASWCMPCRWMDETTFTDPALVQYVEDNYIPVKVDIDDFDGYAYKQVYGIKMLPSILIFNSKGEIVDRYEESLPPSKMLAILKKHNTAANRVKTATAKPKPAPKPKPAVKKEETKIVTRPPLKPTPKPKPAPKPAPAAKPAAPASSGAISTGEGLYRFKVSRQASKGYSVQVGVFGDYGNVLIEAARIEKKFKEPVLVHIAQLNGKKVYRVMIGEFTESSSATEFKEYIKRTGTDCIVKDLSTMK